MKISKTRKLSGKCCENITKMFRFCESVDGMRTTSVERLRFLGDPEDACELERRDAMRREERYVLFH